MPARDIKSKNRPMMQDHTSIKAAQYSYLTFFKAVKQARE
jgi:hypothetical protein